MAQLNAAQTTARGNQTETDKTPQGPLSEDNQSQPLPKRRDAVSQSDWAIIKKKLTSIFHVDESRYTITKS
jgi:hypothetical protein